MNKIKSLFFIYTYISLLLSIFLIILLIVYPYGYLEPLKYFINKKITNILIIVYIIGLISSVGLLILECIDYRKNKTNKTIDIYILEILELSLFIYILHLLFINNRLIT